MTLTERQKQLVQSSFEKVAPISEVAAELFYNRLFIVEPSVRPMFRGDLKAQGRKLMQMLSVAVHGLDHLDKLVPAIEDLGRRHVRYGVEAHHYDVVGESLIWTLEQGLGKDFTTDVREAWVATYTLIASTAKAAAYEAEPA